MIDKFNKETQKVILFYLDDILKSGTPQQGSIRSKLSIDFYERLSRNKELSQTINNVVATVSNTKLFQMMLYVDDAS